MIDVELIVQTIILYIVVNLDIRSILVRYRKQYWIGACERDNILIYRYRRIDTQAQSQ
jgi:hypothetical protein